MIKGLWSDPPVMPVQQQTLFRSPTISPLKGRLEGIDTLCYWHQVSTDEVEKILQYPPIKKEAAPDGASSFGHLINS